MKTSECMMMALLIYLISSWDYLWCLIINCVTCPLLCLASSPGPFCYSACNIEKLGMGMGLGMMLYYYTVKLYYIWYPNA